MPFVCPTTGEMAECFECGADISCACERGSLATVTVIMAASAVTKASERWHWKEDADLTAGEALQLKAMKERGVLMIAALE